MKSVNSDTGVRNSNTGIREDSVLRVNKKAYRLAKRRLEQSLLIAEKTVEKAKVEWVRLCKEAGITEENVDDYFSGKFPIDIKEIGTTAVEYKEWVDQLLSQRFPLTQGGGG